MREDPGAKSIPGRHEAVEAPGFHTLQTAAKPRVKRHVLVGLQEEGIEERLAELLIAGPGFAGFGDLERSDVDEDRTGTDPPASGLHRVQPAGDRAAGVQHPAAC